MVEMKSKDGWRWFGFAGHLIVGNRCAYHLATLVNDGRYLVSTVGHYLPPGRPTAEGPEPIGAGEDSLFETYVFESYGVDADGDPNILSLGEIDGQRYASSLDAEVGHYEYCHKWDVA